jgi:hypothetical protein
MTAILPWSENSGREVAIMISCVKEKKKKKVQKAKLVHATLALL